MEIGGNVLNYELSLWWLLKLWNKSVYRYKVMPQVPSSSDDGLTMAMVCSYVICLLYQVLYHMKLIQQSEHLHIIILYLMKNGFDGDSVSENFINNITSGFSSFINWQVAWITRLKLLPFENNTSIGNGSYLTGCSSSGFLICQRMSCADHLIWSSTRREPSKSLGTRNLTGLWLLFLFNFISFSQK